MRRALGVTTALVIALASCSSTARADAGGLTEDSHGQAGCEPTRPDAIVRTGTRAWLLDRQLVAWYARHPNEISRIVYVRRHREPDGSTSGYRLMGIGCGSELHLAGLRNGDVLRTVNGRPVRSLPEALLAYFALRSARTLEIEVLRTTGEVEVLTYTLS